MNKGMILLGLLLIVGFSFARPSGGVWQYPWQESIFWRYDCSFDQSMENLDTAEYMYAYGSPYVSWSDLYSMGTTMTGMYGMSWYMEAMYEDYSPTPFRADMASYNGKSSTFKGVFNKILRIYLAHADSGGREYVLGWLQDAMYNYRSCVSPIKIV